MRRAVFAVFGTIAGLVGLLSFKTDTTSVANPPAAVSTTNPGNTSSASSGAATPSSTSSGSTSSSSGTSGSSASSSTSASSTTKTVAGNSIDTRWGPVQVKITVSNGTVTSATAVDYPTNNGRDQEINSYAIPTLEKESIGKSTADIDAVSGATYTSDGYIQSLQSALDKL
jgi:uncharacterized protein with FMN-binding domain